MFRKVFVKDRLPKVKGHYHIVDIDGNNDAYGFEPTDPVDVQQWEACVDYWIEEIQIDPLVNIMERWHLGRANDIEVVDCLNEVLKDRLTFFNEPKEPGNSEALKMD